MWPSDLTDWTISSVNSGHLRSVFCGQPTSVLTHGVEATTTSRIHRTTHERWRVQHLRDRTTKAKVLGRQQRQTHRPRKQHEVMHHYEQVMKTLARSDRGEDRQLAVDLVRYLGGQG